MSVRRFAKRATGPILGLLALCAAAYSQVSDAPKTLTVYIPTAPGGSYDLYGRMLARHIGRHLPGDPNVVASNIPGGSGIVMANFLAQRAPRDGSAIAILHQTMAEEQALGAENVQFDVSQFQWIGRITSNVEIAYTWHSSAAKTMEDVKRRETVMSAAGPPGFVFPHLLNKTIGTQFKIIRGYQGTKEANLAMERGETEGSTSSINTIVTTTDWMDSGKLNILVQYAPSRHPKLPDVPTVIELVSAPEDKTLFTFLTQGSAIGRSFAAPPGTPRQHVEALRAAFDQTMKDPLFLAEIEKTKAEFEPATGAQLQQMFAQRAGLSSANKERAQAARKEN